MHCPSYCPPELSSHLALEALCPGVVWAVCKAFRVLADIFQQKLQRRIANSRGVAPDVSLVSPTQAAVEELKLQDVVKTEVPAVDGREVVVPVATKRKYRRHPKVGSDTPSYEGYDWRNLTTDRGD